MSEQQFEVWLMEGDCGGPPCDGCWSEKRGCPKDPPPEEGTVSKQVCVRCGSGKVGTGQEFCVICMTTDFEAVPEIPRRVTTSQCDTCKFVKSDMCLYKYTRMACDEDIDFPGPKFWARMVDCPDCGATMFHPDPCICGNRNAYTTGWYERAPEWVVPMKIKAPRSIWEALDWLHHLVVIDTEEMAIGSVPRGADGKCLCHPHKEVA